MKTFAFAVTLAFAATSLAHAQSPAEAEKTGDAAPAAAEASSEAETASPTLDGAATALFQKDLIRRHHEGDVAMGVCGGRMTALMWFYQTSVASGREELQSALDSVTSARETIKSEAERRALEDGVDTTVRVMNDQTADIWNGLIEASEKDDKAFQEAYDTLFASVEECLDLFFKRDKAAEETGEADSAEAEAEADEAETDDGKKSEGTK